MSQCSAPRTAHWAPLELLYYLLFLTRKCFMPGFTAAPLRHSRNGSDVVKYIQEQQRKTQKIFLVLQWESISQNPTRHDDR